MLHVQSLESKHRLAEVIREMICAAEQDGEATTRGIFRKLFLRHGRVTLEPVGRRHFFEPFRQFSVYGDPCSANLFVRRSDGLRLVRINDEGNVKLGITSFSQPEQRQHRVVNGCQMSPQVEQPVSARRYFLQNLLGREGSKKLVRPIDLGFPCFQPESCIRAFVSHGSFSSQRLQSFPEGAHTHSWQFDSSRRSRRSFLSAGMEAPVATYRILFKTSPRYPVHWPGPLRQYSELL